MSPFVKKGNHGPSLHYSTRTVKLNSVGCCAQYGRFVIDFSCRQNLAIIAPNGILCAWLPCLCYCFCCHSVRFVSPFSSIRCVALDGACMTNAKMLAISFVPKISMIFIKFLFGVGTHFISRQLNDVPNFSCIDRNSRNGIKNEI